ncbi:cyclic nucleotide-binding domain-containing protein [Persicobacter diffluens]|uniref:Cyclic nucleotide-binding domain-containing protein n=1 Tax=Persicobacter diffluens TaxID=981 RepID=A0AAN4VZT9_9BACT|nr:hypothetical protein PEDI_33350 [Persicobacter diffluens]
MTNLNDVNLSNGEVFESIIPFFKENIDFKPQKVTYNSGDLITVSHAKTNYIHILIRGKIQFYLHSSELHSQIPIAKFHSEGTPIGWSGFTPPFRHKTTCKAISKEVVCYRWELETIREKMASHSHSVMEFLNLIIDLSRNLIGETMMSLFLQAEMIPFENPIALEPENYETLKQPSLIEIAGFLKRTPFFEIFKEQEIFALAPFLERRHYPCNSTLYDQGAFTDGLYFLISGEVTLSVHPEEEPTYFLYRSIETEGLIVGFSGKEDLPNMVRATASTDALVYYLPYDSLLNLMEHDAEFKTRFLLRILWLSNHQLQDARCWQLALQTEQEQYAMEQLINQNALQLSLQSPLHKLPALIQSPTTLADALQLVKFQKMHGSPLERKIAALADDILRERKKEQAFFSGLIQTYEAVSQTPAGTLPSMVRNTCAQGFKDACKGVHFKISGLEHLPADSGNIFIYNHLLNHPYYTLPNHFQITLDSHFISAQILQEYYGDSGLRIVRVGKDIEYGHQDYYEKLGHIDVYTSESERRDLTDEKLALKRQEIFQLAGEYLAQGGNLMISPEGTSFPTDATPGKFKTGAFRMAASLPSQPLLVPIVMLNFDRRIINNQWICRILPPVDIREAIKPYGGDIKQFVTDFHQYFKSKVEETKAGNY